MTDAFIGVMLFVAAATTCLVAPRLSLILTIDSPGVNQVFIPVAYWAAVIAAAALLSRRTKESFRRELARVFVAAFATHMLLLLGVSAARNLDRTAFATAVYWLYARAFYVAAIAASIAWVTQQIRARLEERLALVAVGLAATVLAAMTVWRDPGVGIAGTIGGVAAAWWSAHGWPRSAFGRARDWLADDRVVVGAAFALALGVRLLYTMRVMSDPNYLETGPDARFYDGIAWGLVNGGSPLAGGYPLLILGHVRFLAAIYWLFGHSYLAVCIVQSLIGAAAAAAVYVIGKPVFGATASLIAALFAALNFQLTFWAAAIGYQSLDIGFTVFLVWLLIRAVERWSGTWWVWAIAGMAFGCAISVRETTSTFLAFACAWALWAIPRRRPAERWRAVAVMTAAAVLVLVPMIAPMVATSERRTAMRGHFDRLASAYQVHGHEGLAEPMSDPGAALQQLREQPAFVLGALAKGVVHNIGMQFFTQPYGAFDFVSLRKGTDYYFAVWCYAYLLTVVGIVVAARRIRAGDPRSAALVMILGVIASRTLVHLYLQSGYRHRAPLEPFLILLCAAGVMAVLRAAYPARANDGVAVGRTS